MSNPLFYKNWNTSLEMIYETQASQRGNDYSISNSLAQFKKLELPSAYLLATSVAISIDLAFALNLLRAPRRLA